MERLNQLAPRDFRFELPFQLYDERELAQILKYHSLELIDAEDPDTLGGIMYFKGLNSVEQCFFKRPKKT